MGVLSIFSRSDYSYDALDAAIRDIEHVRSIVDERSTSPIWKHEHSKSELQRMLIKPKKLIEGSYSTIKSRSDLGLIGKREQNHLINKCSFIKSIYEATVEEISVRNDGIIEQVIEFFFDSIKMVSSIVAFVISIDSANLIARKLREVNLISAPKNGQASLPSSTEF